MTYGPFSIPAYNSDEYRCCANEQNVSRSARISLLRGTLRNLRVKAVKLEAALKTSEGRAKITGAPALSPGQV
eukprot:821769-Pleurochrysis_carterae.AAC.1